MQIMTSADGLSFSGDFLIIELTAVQEELGANQNDVNLNFYF